MKEAGSEGASDGRRKGKGREGDKGRGQREGGTGRET